MLDDRRGLVLCFALCVSFVCSQMALAQCNLQPRSLGLPGVAGTAAATTQWDPDGAGPLPPLLVVGGRFHTAGDQAVANVAAYDPATRTWTSLGGGVTGFVGVEVRAFAELPNGELVVAGEFSHAGGLPAMRIARFDGHTWTPIGAPNDTVHALAMLPNGNLVAAGEFTQFGLVAANRIAAWDGSTWTPLGAGVAWPGNLARVMALTVLPGGDLVAGGWFTEAGGAAAVGIARWNGASWSAIGGSLNSAALALEVTASGDLVAAGEFGTAGGVAAIGIARFDGASWSAIGGGLLNRGVLGMGYGLTTLPGGDLVVVGRFTAAGGVPADNVARWDGSQWHALGAGIDDDGLTAKTWPNGDLFVGGKLLSASGQRAFSVARWDGGGWSSLNDGIGGSVASLTQLPNGDVVAGGYFTTIDGVDARSIASWDGTAWQPFGLGLDGAVEAVTTMPNGDLVATGGFLHSGGTLVGRLARWDGLQWQAMGPTTYTALLALATLSDGTILAGGFGPWGLRAWDGANWPMFGGSAVQGAVHTILPLPNGAFYAGGSFLTTGVPGTRSVALWDGSAWQALGGGLDETVHDLAVAADGSLFAVGTFDVVNGSTFGRVARWDGAAWSPLGSGLAAVSLGFVDGREVEILPNGDVLVLGAFDTAGGVPVDGFARWDGSTWSAEPGTSYLGWALLVRADGLPMVGGSFYRVGGVAAPFLSTLEAGCPAVVVDLGGGCSGSAGPNQLEAEGLPWIGSTLRSRGTGLTASSLVSFVYSMSQASTPLSALLPQGAPGCDLLVAPDYLELGVPSSGEVESLLYVPNAIALVGLDLYQQFVELEFATGPGLVNVTSSNAIVRTLGAL